MAWWSLSFGPDITVACAMRMLSAERWFEAQSGLSILALPSLFPVHLHLQVVHDLSTRLSKVSHL